jgi:hypothetical protein
VSNVASSLERRAVCAVRMRRWRPKINCGNTM